MFNKKKIQAKEIINDIRSGMSDLQLMTKYRLSAKGLRSAYSKLLELKVLSEKDFYERDSSASKVSNQPTVALDTVIVEDERELARLRPNEPIPIYGNSPNIKGFIKDITLKGIGIEGIQTIVGEKRSFVIFPEKYLPIEPISFDAQCIWVRKTQEGNILAGFRILHITPEGQQELIKLMRIVHQTFVV
jgi:hypothetical protein